MSILGSGGSGVLFQLDGQGAIVSSGDLFVNGWLRASGLTELYGGLTTTTMTTATCSVAGALSVGGQSRFTGEIAGTSLNLSGSVNAGGVVALNPSGIDSGVGRGLRYWDASSSEYATYMAQYGAGKSAAGGVATQGGVSGTPSAFAGYAIRNRQSANVTRGWIWENSAEECAMSLRSDGHAYVRQSLRVGGAIDCQSLTVDGGTVATTSQLNSYLSKGEFDTYNLTESLKELAQAALNAAFEASIDGVEAGVAILGTSLIAGTFTLGGQLINNVDAAFLNVDGRLLSVSTVLSTANSAMVSVNAAILLRATTLSVNGSLSLLETGKASVSALTTGLAGKADISYVDSEIADALNQGGYHNSISIVSASLSDSFIVNTDNVTGEIEAYVNLAMDVTTIVALDTKRSPKFISDSSIQADSDWSDGGWLISTNNGDTPYVGFDRLTTTHWSTDGGTFSTSTGNSTSASGYYLQIKYPAAYLLKHYTLFLQSSGTSTANPPRVWTIQGSNNGTAFTIVQSYTKADWGLDTTHTFDVVNEHIPYMYWRIVVTRVQVFQPARERCTIGEWTLYTGWTIGDIKLVSCPIINFKTFKITLADAAGAPVNMANTPIVPWDFNIMITKGGKLCCSGCYRFTRNGALVVITKISPSASTVSIMAALGEGPPVEEAVPAPVGTVIMCAGLTSPAGYLFCDGAAVSRTTYAALYAKIGILWGTGDGTTTFNLPDLRDRFPRCTGAVAGEVGTRKLDCLKSHTHVASTATAGAHGHAGSSTSSGGSHTHAMSSAGDHTHMVNARSDTVGSSNRYSIGAIGDITSYQTNRGANTAGAHTHVISSAGSHSHAVIVTPDTVGHTHSITVNATGDAIETRPMYASLMFCIKF